MLGCLLPQHLLTYLLDSLKVNEKRKGMLLPTYRRVTTPRRHSPTIALLRARAGTRPLVGRLLDAAGRRPVLLTTGAPGRPNPGRLSRSTAPGAQLHEKMDGVEQYLAPDIG